MITNQKSAEMDIHIVLKKGLGDIHFGSTPEVVRAVFGEPEDVEELENAIDGNVESIVIVFASTNIKIYIFTRV